MIKAIEKAWSTNASWLVVLKPFSWIYWILQRAHRTLYESGWLMQTSFQVPVIVVGNIFVGGTGKTPTVLFLAKRYLNEGKKVGIVSRGYRGLSMHYPRWVKSTDDPADVGDEPLLLAQSCDAMVVCDPKRVRGIQYCVDHGCDLIICDDGLQHYRLKPSRRIAVHPGDWKGATDVLPAGPLREPMNRLSAFDEVIYMDDTKRHYYCEDQHGNAIAFEALPKNLQVVTGIAQPERLLRYLDKHNIHYQAHLFSDHYPFRQEDFNLIQGPILMTTKDWVKCRAFHWNQPVYIAGYTLKESS